MRRRQRTNHFWSFSRLIPILPKEPAHTAPERGHQRQSRAFNGRWQNEPPRLYYRTPETAADPEIEPVYGLTAGITNKFISRLIYNALPLIPALPEWFGTQPYEITPGFPAFKPARWNRFIILTAPRLCCRLLPARMRLAYDELLASELSLALVRAKG